MTITSSLQIPEDIPMDADEARIVAGLQGSEQLFYQVSQRV